MLWALLQNILGVKNKRKIDKCTFNRIDSQASGHTVPQCSKTTPSRTLADTTQLNLPSTSQYTVLPSQTHLLSSRNSLVRFQGFLQTALSYLQLTLPQILLHEGAVTKKSKR